MQHPPHPFPHTARPSSNAVVRHPVPPPIGSALPDATPPREHDWTPGPAVPPPPAGLPQATLTARQCYLHHTTPVPGSRSGFRQLGPVRMLVCFWQDRMSLLQIHSDARRTGHGSQAMGLLVTIAERHGLHIVANAPPLAHGTDCLDQRTLTAWYLGFGFERIPGSSMNAIIYAPTRRHRPEARD